MSGTIWTKFFWSDWETEPALRLCSYAAQGLWMRMLCIASAHDPIGYVAVAGRGLDETSIARMTGGSESEVRDLLGELDRNGVFSRDRQGRIFSRRMVKDARRAAIARKNGKKGGNPNLGNNGGNIEGVNRPDNRGLKPQEPSANFQTKEEAKASLSPEATKATTKARVYPEAFEAAWKAYPHHKGRSSKPNAAAQFAKLPPEDRAGLVAAIGRFAPNVGETCGGKGAPDMAVWLKDGKHLNWTAEADTGPPRPAPIFDGPPEVRSWTAERHGEPYARSYIDPSRWDAGSRALIAANPFAEGRMKRDLAEICERWNFTVRQGEVSAPVPSNELFQQGASA